MTPRIAGLAVGAMVAPVSGAVACGPDVPTAGILPLFGTLYLVPVLASILLMGGLYAIAGWQRTGLARMGAVFRLMGSALAVFVVSNLLWVPTSLVYEATRRTAAEPFVVGLLYAVGILGFLGPMLLGPALLLQRSESGGIDPSFNGVITLRLGGGLLLAWVGTSIVMAAPTAEFGGFVVGPLLLVYFFRTLTRSVDWVVDQVSGGIAREVVVRGTVSRLASPALCPVCRDTIADQAWVCDECHMPQHLDCQEFQGRCATYGCGVTPVTRPAGAPKA